MEMEITKIELDNIIPSPYNPRTMTTEEENKLRKNMEKYGLVDPIIINLKNNHIIGGHQRYNILKQKQEETEQPITLKLISMGDIGWLFLENDLKVYDENHEKALNLALNKISGEWDLGKLDTLLQELQLTEFNMDLTGFDKLELSNITFHEPLSNNGGGGS